MENRYICATMDSFDVHQHLWPEPVLRVLERRASAPRASWEGDGWRIDLPGEPCFAVDPSEHDLEAREDALDVDRALVALSSPVGAEGLPARDALAVVAAWHEATAVLPSRFGWWAATPSALGVEGEDDIVRQALSDGAAGLCLPANRLASPADADLVLPLLATVAEAGAPVFVHPGPVHGRLEAPPWWPPATDYVAQQHAAWHAFHDVVRPSLPALRVVFGLLAGLAPLQVERTALRGGTVGEAALSDQLSFYDTSSYGPRGVRAMATAVGIGQLVHGTDYPVSGRVADPVTEAFSAGWADIVRRNAPSRALGYTWVPA
jgi:predicted TIM-barrel fold metal-dependent hydrolase